MDNNNKKDAVITLKHLLNIININNKRSKILFIHSGVVQYIKNIIRF